MAIKSKCLFGVQRILVLMATLEQQIFKKGSMTYYLSSKFFPKDVREDVFRLYSFVRIADDYVDEIPKQPKLFKELRGMWFRAITNHIFDTTPRSDDTVNERVVKNIVYVAHKYDIEPTWIEAFLDAMEADLRHKPYKTLEASLSYVSGSAEMVGLMMAKMMCLPDESLPYAKLQGRTMQWLNFIRDIDEDNKLGRQYFPTEDLKKFGLPNLLPETAQKQPEQFAGFIHFQIKRYQNWQKKASNGFRYIPRRLRIPLQTAVDMYDWTAREIAINPQIVFSRKIKPNKDKVIKTGLKRIIKQS